VFYPALCKDLLNKKLLNFMTLIKLHIHQINFKANAIIRIFIACVGFVTMIFSCLTIYCKYAVSILFTVTRGIAQHKIPAALAAVP
jgi:hypothetical protein